MKPLLKWPGGKTRELSVLAEFLREPVRTYLEPFVGGGAVLFSLAGEAEPNLFSRHPPQRCLVADVNPELVALYRAVAGRDPDLASTLEEFVQVWDEDLPGIVAEHLRPLRDWFLVSGREEGAVPPKAQVEAVLEAFPVVEARALVERSLRDKLRRSHRLEQKHAVEFSCELVDAQLETGLRAGFYTYLRDRREARSAGEGAAIFFFLRQFCYGSMFRQNRQGRFNIPYGGKGYNRKRLVPQVEELLDPHRAAFLRRVEVRECDFRDLFAEARPELGPEDLVFLDPPYDSAFQEYAGRAFGEAEQRALAEVVAELPCRVLGIMQATPLIRDLYREVQARWRVRGRELHLEEYEKTYAYNVRGRNQRDVNHLLIRGN